MGRSLSLAAYAALHRGPDRTDAPDRPPRPDGPLVWIEQGGAARIDPARTLALRLVAAADEAGEELNVLVTSPDRPPLHDAMPQQVTRTAPPPDTAAAARDFLDHWRPDLMIWLAGGLRPVLLDQTDRAGIPRFLAAAVAGGIGPPDLRWFPNLTGSLLRRFDRILARSADDAHQLVRMGAPADRTEVSGDLEEGGPALGCDEAARDALAAQLEGRPVWLAAGIDPAEANLLARAYAKASSLTHRLLLVLAPRQPGDVDMLERTFRNHGLTPMCHGAGARIADATQVCIAGSVADRGLWYRLAPITTMGGTFAGRPGLSPLEPAALGSAITHGPLTGAHAAVYGRLGDAGAARRVTGLVPLCAAIEDLLAPDAAAAMAHAAWMMTTHGAEVTDRLVGLVQSSLE